MPKGQKPFVDEQDPAARDGPFVVSHPCETCGGQGAVTGTACSACLGTGVGEFYHGTKASLKPGDLIKPGHTPNFGRRDRVHDFVYLTGTLDAAIWGAELAVGNGQGHIYLVRPTGPVVNDPNLTDKKYPGNPTRSYRSTAPLLVVGEVESWQGHAPEALNAMKEGVKRAKLQGVEPID